MVKWEIDKCYLFVFPFVHCTHWRFACCEMVALYCVEVLRICKCNDLHETFCRVQETIDWLGAWLVKYPY